MARPASGVTALFYVLTFGAVAFFSGYRPWLFASTTGQVLLLMALIAPVLLVLALRAEKLSWRVTFVVVGFVTVLLVVLIFIPSWYTFTYLPLQRDPLLVR